MNDYFGRSSVPAAPQVTAYAPTPPATGIPNPPSGPPNAPWGSPMASAQPMAPGQAQGWGQSTQWLAYQSSGRSTGTKVAIGLAAAVAAFVALGVLASIVIPVFLNHSGRSLAARTTVSVPAQIAGMAPLADAGSSGYVETLQGMPGPGRHVAGGFGNGGVFVVVRGSSVGASLATQAREAVVHRS